TPGAWRAQPERAVMVTADAGGVAMCFGDSNDEAQANAALIARAPDLLREVEELRAMVGFVPLSVLEGIRNGTMTPEDWHKRKDDCKRGLQEENEELRAQNAELLDLLERAKGEKGFTCDCG